jgi:hypothetical protein
MLQNHTNVYVERNLCIQDRNRMSSKAPLYERVKENSGSLINNLKMTNNENINIIARKLGIKITFK